MWLPLLGIALLLAGALSSYLWVYPGTLNPTVATDDGGTGDAAATGDAAPGAAPAAAPAPGGQLPRPAGGGVPQPPVVR